MAESGYVLDNYLIGLNFMARILQFAPDEKFLRQTRDFRHTLFAWPGVGAQAEKILQEACDKDITALALEAGEDHARLFSGPAPLAPPWESVWREREKLLFGQCEREIAAVYEAWGLIAAAAGREPADHLGLELAFLAFLLDDANDKERTESSSGQSSRQCALELLEQHITRFAPQVLKKAAVEASSAFYRQACQNCLSMLTELESALNKDEARI